MTDPTPEAATVRLRDLAAILLLTAVADLCLYAHPGGAGAGALILAAAAGLAALAPGRPCGATYALFATLLLTAGMSIWHAGVAVGFVAAIAMTALAIKLHRPDWTITEILWAAPWAVLVAPLRLLELLVRPLWNLARSEGRPAGRGNGITLWRVAIPLLVTLVFFLVFAAANPVVEKMWRDGWNNLYEFIAPLFETITITRAISWVGWLLVFAILVRPMIRSAVADWFGRQKETLSAPEKPAEAGGDFATALVTLLCVNALFLAFNAMDSVYLYFKATLPDDITWAQYAHEGCFWLTVALALSTLTIGAVFGCGLTFHARSRTLRVWSYVWAVQNVILAAGALRRLQMYVDYNGLTRLRVVGLYGILLVLFGLGLMVWKVARTRNFLWLVRRDLVAAWAALAVLALTPRDYVCWRYNVHQVMLGNHRPLALLTVQEMSPESYPPLIPLLDHPQEWVREGIAAFLGNRSRQIQPMKDRVWTEWQGADAWACRELEEAGGKISSLVPKEEWGAMETRFFERVRPWVHSGVPLYRED